ncbi:MAG: ABC transporter permease subunit, partial [Synergistaceae bacterium]|nr:ABC transporter permease subunit [Synergistaceae bacterium]
PFEVIFRVYLRESIAPLTRAITITIISLLGLTAMAGAVGAGGLGDFAIRYGHDRNMIDITWVTVIVLVTGVSVVQWLGEFIARRNTH